MMTRINTYRGIVNTFASTLITLSLAAVMLAGIGQLIGQMNRSADAGHVETHRVADILFWETNTNLPDDSSDNAQPAIASDALTVDEIRFLEMNLHLPEGVSDNAQPAIADVNLSAREIGFLEMNIWEFQSVAEPAEADTLIPPEVIPGQPS